MFFFFLRISFPSISLWSFRCFNSLVCLSKTDAIFGMEESSKEPSGGRLKSWYIINFITANSNQKSALRMTESTIHISFIILHHPLLGLASTLHSEIVSLYTFFPQDKEISPEKFTFDSSFWRSILKYISYNSNPNSNFPAHLQLALPGPRWTGRARWNIPSRQRLSERARTPAKRIWVKSENYRQ